MNIKHEEICQGALLTLLYEKRSEKYAYVKPNDFSPPITMQDIGRFGRRFYDAKLIKDPPMEHTEGYFMSISLHGEAVWEGREASLLNLEGLPEQ
jgi:hypothetical protein